MSKSKVKIEEAELKVEPVITSLSLYNVPDIGADAWVVLEIKTQGQTVISSRQIDIPNMKQIAQETLKIAVVKQFFN